MFYLTTDSFIKTQMINKFNNLNQIHVNVTTTFSKIPLNWTPTHLSWTAWKYGCSILILSYKLNPILIPLNIPHTVKKVIGVSNRIMKYELNNE